MLDCLLYDTGERACEVAKILRSRTWRQPAEACRLVPIVPVYRFITTMKRVISGRVQRLFAKTSGGSVSVMIGDQSIACFASNK